MTVTISATGPVVVDFSFVEQRRLQTCLSESKDKTLIACRELVRDLAEGFVVLSGPGGALQRRATARIACLDLRRIGRAADHVTETGAEALRVVTLDLELVCAIEAEFATDKSGSAVGLLRRLLVGVEDEWPGRVDPKVLRHCRVARIIGRERSGRLEPYSPGEIDRLRRAALAEARAVIANAADVRSLLQREELAQLADAATGDVLRAAQPISRRIGRSRRRIVDAIFPPRDDVVALLLLLAAQSAIPISSILSLRRDCLLEGMGGTVRIVYEKPRAGDARYRVKAHPDGGLMTPGGVIRALLTLTEETAKASGSDALVQVLQLTRRDINMCMEVGQRARDDFVDRNDLLDDADQPMPVSFPRVRKTRVLEWARETSGDLHRTSELADHTIAVNWSNYTSVRAAHAMYDETITAGLAHAASVGAPPVPKVVSSQAEEAARADPAGTEPGSMGLRTSTAVAVALKADSATWFASCSGVEGSPFESNGRCTDPFWGCLECPNAVLFESKLPAILAALDRIVSVRSEMSAADWRQSFGRPFRRIVGDIVPAFGEAAWDCARTALTQGGTPLVALPAGVFDA